MEESLRAAVTGLGIEILGALCARAEPAAARVRLCSLVPQKFTSKMYAELCRFMETCHAGQMAEWPAVPGCLKDADETRGHAGVLPKNLEDEYSVIPEEEAKHLENGESRGLQAIHDKLEKNIYIYIDIYNNIIYFFERRRRRCFQPQVIKLD